MRTIDSRVIVEAVEKLCMDANYYLGEDVKCALEESLKAENSELGRDIIGKILQNSEIARKKSMPICQDTGMAIVFVEYGQDVHIEGNLTEAINQGVRQGYEKGYLRKSVVRDPLKRVNTDDNTPAIIHCDIVPGDKLKITVAPKGFGSENMSALKMLKPSDGEKGVIDFVLETVKKAGPNPCPPIIVGVGIGGSMEMAALLSKRALLRDLSKDNPDEYYRNLEALLLEEINKLNIGPQGLGGRTTALKVCIETFPTHIAGLPVAVNINCHVARHKTLVL